MRLMMAPYIIPESVEPPFVDDLFNIHNSFKFDSIVLLCLIYKVTNKVRGHWN